MGVSMQTQLSRLPPDQPPGDHARASLRAIGSGYLFFARTEPGLFRTAFGAPVQGRAGPPEPAGHTGLDPFQMLGAALDAMVAVNVLPSERRPAAEFLAWSAVHGLAMLVLDGPLSTMDPRQIDAIIPRLLELVEKGL